MIRCEPHGNLILDPSVPFPLGVNTDYCHTCWRAAGGVKRAGAVPASPPAARRSLPCVHVGDPAGPAGWHLCEHPDEPLGLVVCGCKGCGVRCPGFTPATATTSRAGRQPPPAGAPTSTSPPSR